MFRYFALVWDHEESAQADAAHLIARQLSLNTCGWRAVVTCDDLQVFVIDERSGSSQALVLKDGLGVVVGTLFSRQQDDGTSYARAKTELSPEECRRIVASGGRDLIDNYWGRYVAFLRDPQTRVRWILRDPIAQLPCFHTVLRGARVYCSVINDYACLGLSSLTINWDYVAAYSVAPFVHSRETGLAEVAELPGGECVRIDADTVTTHSYWNPFQFTGSKRIDDPHVATSAIRRTVTTCIHSWASCYEGILHHLSGGLDSSIVLACLASAPTRPQVHCVNYHSAISGGDERIYARTMAAQVGCELFEVERQPVASLEGITRLARTASPLLIRNRNIEVDRSETELARVCRATALFGGEGGDQVFYQNPVLAAAGDYVRDHGIRTRLLSIALNIAQLDSLSVWRVLRQAIRDGYFPSEWDPHQDAYKGRPLVSRSVIDALRKNGRFLHPWFQTTRSIPRGKLWHAYMLSIPQQFYSPLAADDAPEPVEPLTSQPLVELCLRIPTYILTIDGWDRSVARRAFVGRVPAQILNRRSKGGIEEYVKQTLMQNIRFVREMLLDGVLVNKGILDRAKLEDALSNRPSNVGSYMADVMDHLTTEAWLRTWIEHRRRAAA